MSRADLAAGGGVASIVDAGSPLEAVAFEMEGQKDKVLVKYRAALERGERRLSIVKHVLELMNEQGLNAEANALYNRLDEKSRRCRNWARLPARL